MFFFLCCILLSFNPFRIVLKWMLKCDSSFVFHNDLRKIVMLSWEDSFFWIPISCLPGCFGLGQNKYPTLKNDDYDIRSYHGFKLIFYPRTFFPINDYDTCAEIQTRPLENILKSWRLYFITYYYVTFLDATPTTNQ